LSQQVQHNLLTAVEILKKYGAEVKTGGKVIHETGFYFQNTLLAIPGDKFLDYPRELQTEAFGPATLLVLAQDAAQMKNIVGSLEGNLTGSLYSHSGDEDDPLYSQIEPILRPRVGRLLNDKMPTGVAVSPAMAHGGPYPATGHPGFTSVGIPRALLRFTAMQCYDNVRPHRLPSELQNQNPTRKMWRYIDGTWTQADIPL
jgi:NADP-dependent aldehyde dehydrogenase